jgi:outer membrane receptor protein involved in Fe transport
MKCPGLFASLFQTIVIASLLGASGLMAQDATGRIAGAVLDSQGSVIPGVKVTVTNAETGIAHSTVTDQEGAYRAVSLPIGSYTVAAEKVGFRKAVSMAQRLQINATLRIDLNLEVGAISETVEVNETAAGVEVQNATLGNSVTSNQIVNAPLDGRDVLDLALYVPGVIPSDAGGAGGFSVAGGRQDSVTYLLDGGANNNLLDNGVVYNPNPDTVAEFKILTSNYGAEFGRNGGGIVSVVTKSGTNTYHGSAYDYVRNNALNANSFFNNASGVPKEILKRNQFGGTLGGPIEIPKLVHGKDRFFFFFGYQGQRQSALNTTSKTTVYTPDELRGDFSKSNNGSPDPDVASFLAANPYFQSNPALASQAIIDPTRFNTVTGNYIKAGLVPSSASGYMLSQGHAVTNNDEYTGKFDFQATAKDRISVTLGYLSAPSTSPFTFASVSGFPNKYDIHQSFGNAAYTHTFTPNLLNDFRLTVQRNNNLQAVPDRDLPLPNAMGIGIVSDDPHGPTNIELDGSGLYLGFSSQGPTSKIDNTYNWSDALTWIRGHHTIKTGFNYTPYQNNTVYDYYVNGDFYFYGPDSSQLPNDKAAFLLGLPDEYLQFPKAPSNIRTYNLSGFVQDEWRLSRRLSVNFGLRYEYNSPKHDTQGRTFSLALGKQSQVFPNAPRGLLFPGDPGAPNGANFPNKKDFAPRFGFAYDPLGDGKTSIRGGFGMFFDILKAEDNIQFNGQAPFFGYADLYFDPLSENPSAEPNYMSDPFGAAGQTNPFPSKAPAKDINFDDAGFLPFGGSSVYFVNPHLKTPYVLQYNLSIQREIMRNTTLEASYIGSNSHRLTGLVDANPFVLGTTQRLFNTQADVPSYAFSYLDMFDNVGKANYNSLALGLTRQTSEVKGFGSVFYQFSYTYGKSIDNESGYRTNNGRVAAYNHDLFRAVSDYDVTHYISVNASWELPFAHWWTGAPARLTKGWTLYPVMSYRSGRPLDIRAFISRSRTRPGPSAVGDPNLVRPNLVSPIRYFDAHKSQDLGGNTGNYYFDPSAFAYQELIDMGSSAVYDASLRTYGSLGRNAFRGPGQGNVNLTIAKITPLWNERMKSEFRLDFFNLLNHAEFSDPNTTITNAEFGQISSTAQPRVIQMALRLSF